MTLDEIILKGIFEHKRLKPTIIRTSCGDVKNLAELRQVMNTDLELDQYSSHFVVPKIKISKIVQYIP